MLALQGEHNGCWMLTAKLFSLSMAVEAVILFLKAAGSL
jgi:hypothetical protein